MYKDIPFPVNLIFIINDVIQNIENNKNKKNITLHYPLNLPNVTNSNLFNLFNDLIISKLKDLYLEQKINISFSIDDTNIESYLTVFIEFQH